MRVFRRWFRQGVPPSTVVSETAPPVQRAPRRLLTRDFADPILEAGEQALGDGLHTATDPFPAFQIDSAVSRLDAAKALLYGIADCYRAKRHDARGIERYTEAVAVFTQRIWHYADKRDQRLVGALESPDSFLKHLSTLDGSSPDFDRQVVRRVNAHAFFMPRATEAIAAGLLPALPVIPPAELVEVASLRAPSPGVYLALRQYISYGDDPDSVLISDAGSVFDLDNEWDVNTDSARLALEQHGQWLRFFPADESLSSDQFLIWRYADARWTMEVGAQALA